MINISKRSQPSELIQYKKQKGAVFDGPNFTPIKNVVRSSLAKEQGYLCAYCMKSIKDDSQSTKVEHWFSQKKFPNQQLDYKNLLLVCLGNKGQPERNEHCDTKKGNDNLHFNPSDSNHDVESKIRYFGNGKIGFYNDPKMENDIKTLNLNEFSLVNKRKAILDGIMAGLNRKPGPRSGAEIEKKLEAWMSKKDERLVEFCGVAIYYLRNKLLKLV